MNITKAAIENSRVTLVVLVFIILAGINTYLGMPRSEDPGFIIRVAQIRTYFPGASPERVEQLITDKLEKAVQEIPELDFVSNTSKIGQSIISVNIKEEYKNMRPVWDSLRRKIDNASGKLPEGIIGPVINDEFGDVFGILIALTGDGFDYAELKQVADAVRDELLLIAGTAKVEIHGAQEERVFVEYDNATLSNYGLSPVQLQQMLRSRNIIQPGGNITLEYEKIVIEPTGNFESVNDISRTIINLPNSSEVIYLEDIVKISRGYIDPPDSMVTNNGETSLVLGISLREGGNIISLGKDVKSVIERAKTVYPIGIEFDDVQFQPAVVEKKVADFESNLFQAVMVVTLVMLFTLGLRTGLIVASLIPVTILSAFLVMNVFSIGLDQMSLAALIIALGMLVDNAIVMSESIMVQMQAGVEARKAAIACANELRIPLLTSSLTTAAAFLPIYLSESSTGEYTAPLFKVVSITLLCSWVIALTLIPLLCVSAMKVKKRASATSFDNRFYNNYRRLLLSLVKHPLISLLGVLFIFVIALQGLNYVPKLFFPENDRPTFTIELELPEGTPIERTRSITAIVEQYLLDNLMAVDGADGVVNWGSFIGAGAPRFILSSNPEPPNPAYAILVVNTTRHTIINPQIIPAIDSFIKERFADVEATIKKLEVGAPAWPPIAIRISGRDTDKLFSIVDKVKEKLRQTEGATQISDSWGTRSKKILLDIDETRARLSGISHEDIAISLQTYFSGLETTEYREQDKLIPIVLRSSAGHSDNNYEGAFPSINVYSQAQGSSVPLSQVAEPELVWQPGKIERRNRLRNVTVEALLKPGFTVEDVLSEIEPWLIEESLGWPFGYKWEFGGTVETSGKANQAIADKLPVAALIIVILLVIQFNSIRRPLIILTTIPLALIGVTIGLLLARSYFGFMTLLGIISLAGIVINNAIVLLDRINLEINQNGKEAAAAIISSAQQRLRPILLTTATTVCGLIPLWLGGGPMWEPMAITIIFGLLFSTALTLAVVPVLYTLLFKVSFRSYSYQTE
ncbi:MAG: MMPL family transporter [Gammaproteobacteria bacterium]|nr:MMPL family transporter [Gammaproteobacteria bacterium]